ncbi:DEKNAAC104107 [Brettanomyces naardenensis]|uniref:DEKNAAC104107 n=1 Tax=Brettanomyces naardenensis TaxID=13370 RepID=A0A448YQ96_BRENA|nr:DEKNAAC104107 [Brettanomyces naardenensis]
MSSSDWKAAIAEHKVDPKVKAEARKKFHFRPSEDAPTSKIAPENTVQLEAIDLSKYKEGEEGLPARKELADQLEGAVTKYGFFKVTNFAPKELLEQLFSLSQSTFEEPDEVKKQFFAGEHNLPHEKNRPLGVVRGSGYKPAGFWKYTENKTPDNVEFFNIRNFTQFDTFFNKTEYPEFIKANLDDIAYYFNYVHHEVLRKVLNLIDLILELPEGFLYENYFSVVQGDLANSPDGSARFLLYRKVTDEYNEKTGNIWMRGHADQDALTFLLSQPILSLQIRDHDTNQWKYVTHTPGALIVNIGDMFSQISGGYFKSSIHRVVTAPEDQRQYDRNTALYFCNPVPTTYLDPDAVHSPKLDRLGYKRDAKLERITAAQWDDKKGEFFNRVSENRTKDFTLFGRPTVGSLVV